MHVCYNEIEEYACDWLENLSRDNLIAPGHVDRRSIEDVVADELAGFRQVHLFAGIGVWSYALRCTGVPDDFPLWTGSCPCQPFSAAGKGGGMEDERHLWPAFYHLIRECRPPVVFGEQVASKDGLGWLDLVQADLEAAGYAIGTVDTCSAGNGAPHIRQRLRFCAYDLRLASIWMGNTLFEGLERLSRDGNRERGRQIEARSASATSSVVSLEHDARDRREQRWPEPSGRGTASGCSVVELADADQHQPRQRRDTGSAEGEGSWTQSGRCGATGKLDDTISNGRGARWNNLREYDGLVADADVGFVALADTLDGHIQEPFGRPERRDGTAAVDAGSARTRPGPTNGFWRDADWLFCRDGKWRPIRPGSQPLVNGSAFRVGSGSPYEGKSRQGMLKGYGNAIDAHATIDFIIAALGHRPYVSVSDSSLEDLLG